MADSTAQWGQNGPPNCRLARAMAPSRRPLSSSRPPENVAGMLASPPRPNMIVSQSRPVKSEKCSVASRVSTLMTTRTAEIPASSRTIPRGDRVNG